MAAVVRRFVGFFFLYVKDESCIQKSERVMIRTRIARGTDPDDIVRSSSRWTRPRRRRYSPCKGRAASPHIVHMQSRTRRVGRRRLHLRYPSQPTVTAWCLLGSRRRVERKNERVRRRVTTYRCGHRYSVSRLYRPLRSGPRFRCRDLDPWRCRPR
jgi:hypothetical protein